MRTLVSVVAQYAVLLSIIGLLAAWFSLDRHRKARYILEVIVCGIMVYGLSKIGNATINDPRPFIVGHFSPYFTTSLDNGFPSDHTLLATFCGFIVLQYNRKLGSSLLMLAVIIGAARVIGGAHHVLDIVGGFAIALLGVVIGKVLILFASKYSTASHDA